ncbi:hypothetical protein DERF_006380 [Dermatophagoides farinae]|uniref:Uncharacterized protein n=1 Tax=Dermatophagoides farinae TaxID=6954 RepID=A0A922L9L8_DERFA|nr:hypothetical protein DERF_006380 [Dermatophagoides farinae]
MSRIIIIQLLLMSITMMMMMEMAWSMQRFPTKYRSIDDDDDDYYDDDDDDDDDDYYRHRSENVEEDLVDDIINTMKNKQKRIEKPEQQQQHYIDFNIRIKDVKNNQPPTYIHYKRYGSKNEETEYFRKDSSVAPTIDDDDDYNDESLRSTRLPLYSHSTMIPMDTKKQQVVTKKLHQTTPKPNLTPPSTTPTLQTPPPPTPPTPTPPPPSSCQSKPKQIEIVIHNENSDPSMKVFTFEMLKFLMELDRRQQQQQRRNAVIMNRNVNVYHPQQRQPPMSMPIRRRQ